MNGLYPFYKPPGITSNDFLGVIKKQLRPRVGKVKVGHGGTLDRDAEGVLVVGIGSGTKKLGTLLHGNKTYFGTGRFGFETDTDDAGGTVIGDICDDGEITFDKLNDIVKTFQGNIKQVPPTYCALKKKGKRCSDMARAGEEVILDPKDVNIHDITGLFNLLS